MTRSIQQNGIVTVVIPTYNRESYIENCVSSVLGQTYTKLEVLVVDDGSTDNTLEILNRIKKTDKRLRIKTHPTNSGSMNKALHGAILECSSEYFTWIGSDDTYATVTAIEQLVETHRSLPDIDYISCNLRMRKQGHNNCPYCENIWPLYSGYSSTHPYDHASLKNYDKTTYVRRIYNTLCPPFPWNGMWKTKFFAQNNITWIEYKGNTWSPDTLNGLHFFRHDMSMHHYNHGLISYTLHENQDTVTGAVREQIRCDVTLLEAIHEWFEPRVYLETVSESADDPFLIRLKRLAEGHAARFESSDNLRDAVAGIAVTALTYAWENDIKGCEEAIAYFKTLV